MGAWTTGGTGGGGPVSVGGDRRDFDDEESVEAGTIEPGGPDVATDDPDCAGQPPIARLPPMLEASLKVRWERLLVVDAMEKDDGGRICEAEDNGGRGIYSITVGS
jgi:hypothetical protein